MSANKHRQPIVNWSSVVLLSTLLLSPMTAGALLHALAQAFPRAFSASADERDGTATAAAEETGKTGDPAPIRRANDEQEALRQAVAQERQRRAERLESDPARQLAAPYCSFSLDRLPTVVGEKVAEARRVAWPSTIDSTARSRIIAPAPPRAPPV